MLSYPLLSLLPSLFSLLSLSLIHLQNKPLGGRQRLSKSSTASGPACSSSVGRLRWGWARGSPLCPSQPTMKRGGEIATEQMVVPAYPFLLKPPNELLFLGNIESINWNINKEATRSELLGHRMPCVAVACKGPPSWVMACSFWKAPHSSSHASAARWRAPSLWSSKLR